MTAIFGDNWIKVQDEKGRKSVQRSSHIKYVEPGEKLVQQLPGKEILQNYGRSSKLLIAAKDIPDLRFNLEKTEMNGEAQEHLENTLEGADEVQEVTNNLILPMAAETLCVGTSKASKNRKQSKNLLNGSVGVALNYISQEEVMEITVNPKPRETYSKNCDYLQNSLSEGACAARRLKTAEMMVMSRNIIQKKTCKTDEESQKSWDTQEIYNGVKQSNTNHHGPSLR